MSRVILITETVLRALGHKSGMRSKYVKNTSLASRSNLDTLFPESMATTGREMQWVPYSDNHHLGYNLLFKTVPLTGHGVTLP